MTVTIINRGEGFRQKVRQALDVWARVKPHEVRQFVRDCKALRQQKLDTNGYFVTDSGKRDTDQAMLGITPPFVDIVLGQSEFTTQFLYGVPCGTGERLWRMDPQNDRIFKEELACGILSPMKV